MYGYNNWGNYPYGQQGNWNRWTGGYNQQCYTRGWGNGNRWGGSWPSTITIGKCGWPRLRPNCDRACCSTQKVSPGYRNAYNPYGSAWNGQGTSGYTSSSYPCQYERYPSGAPSHYKTGWENRGMQSSGVPSNYKTGWENRGMQSSGVPSNYKTGWENRVIQAPGAPSHYRSGWENRGMQGMGYSPYHVGHDYRVRGRYYR
ncbi:unnamed protein product [Meganyctiphanes norvegica]|uniref:Uncharacterized protein n=1 Tax=Meganyctiphanes norvegica TaxID=48144 RepID=A0AAV2PTR9_MEGNR